MTRSRPYRSRLRARQADQTRQEILAAARSLFADQGYSPTSVSSIARLAGVTPQTVYSNFGSKPGLALALIAYMNELAGVVTLAHGVTDATTPREMIRASVHLVCVLHEKVGDLIRVLIHAAQAEPALEEAVAAGRASHAEPQAANARKLAEYGLLHDDVDESSAAGLLNIVIAPEAIERYLVEEGWSYSRIEVELTNTLVRALCRPGAGDAPWPDRVGTGA